MPRVIGPSTLLPKGEHKTEAYLKVNPRGKVPALSVDGKVITENTAILTYLADTPVTATMPDVSVLDVVQRARAAASRVAAAGVPQDTMWIVSAAWTGAERRKRPP